MSSLYRPFRSVLIANRGEIASRIRSEAMKRDLRTIAVYSDADKGAYHTAWVDMAIRIGPPPPVDSYLNIEAILSAAEGSRAEAIHPGYGFLAENADFAQAVIDAGLVWIGPPPSAIRALGNKGQAKQIAAKVDVPLIPGYQGDNQSPETLAREAARIGYPVMIKAANGGGGRGMRRVDRADEFAANLDSAKREALSSFGSEEMILEKAMDRVRHVEFQVFGDSQGSIVHMGERDCSIQRRNQKIIEEAPCPVLTAELRQRMGDAAVRLAKAVDYVNAGTVEFLLDEKLNFYFLEMNARIQVEHPVTEEITSLNLIQLQFDVASGKPLGLRQEDIKFTGHAIEARLCTEDPADGFRPQTGDMVRFSSAARQRVDRGIGHPGPVTGHYDSMIAKVISKGATREEARKALIINLLNVQALGVKTNRNYLIHLLKQPDVVVSNLDIGWLSRQAPFHDDDLDSLLGQAAALWIAGAEKSGWSSNGTRRCFVHLRQRDRTKTFVIENGRIAGNPPDSSPALTFPSGRSGWAMLEVAPGRNERFDVVRKESLVHVSLGGRDALFEDITYAPAERKGGASDGMLRAPMDGKIVAVRAAAGDKVAKGQVLVVLEAMKMEHEIAAAMDGVVEAVSVKASDQVSTRQVLVTLKGS